MTKEKSFKFHIPVELVKGKDKEVDAWKIQGVASTPDEDLQGEIVNQNGLDISFLKAGRGTFNWDHQKGPENILGKIDDADFVKLEGKQALMVKGYLFQHQDRSKAFHNIMRSLRKTDGPRVHMSIEGKILERDLSNRSHIRKARVEKVALTMDPVNPYTYADLCKSLVAVEQITDPTQPVEITEFTSLKKSEIEQIVEIAVQKALSAGAGYSKAPEARADGEAMTKESMDRKNKNVTYGSERKKRRSKMLKCLIESFCESHPDQDPIELAQWALEAYKNKVK
jgi:hypothetical protein